MTQSLTLGFTGWFEEKLKECTRAAGYLKKLLERDIKPRYAPFLTFYSRV
jgi:ribosome-binding factor A